MARPFQSLDPVITGFYDRTPEENRLQQGAFQLEEARTREVIGRFAPAPPGTVPTIWPTRSGPQASP
jgi:hypothetical protein